MLPEFSQHLGPIDFRQIQIQQKNIRTRCFPGFSHLRQIGKRLRAIFHYMQLVLNMVLLQCFLHQQNVARIVLSQQNLQHSESIRLEANPIIAHRHNPLLSAVADAKASKSIQKLLENYPKTI